MRPQQRREGILVGILEMIAFCAAHGKGLVSEAMISVFDRVLEAYRQLVSLDDKHPQYQTFREAADGLVQLKALG